MSEPSDTSSLDGSSAPHGSTARGRTHLGGSQLESDSYQAIISPPVTGQDFTGQPVTGHPVTGQPITSQDFTSHPVTSQPVTSQPGTSQPATSQPVTGQLLPGTSHRSLNLDYQSPGTSQFITSQQSPVIQSPVIGPHSSYPASISSHNSSGSNRRLAIHRNLGSEHSCAHELRNPATSSRIILPLEPDFSQMSDPSVIIEPPNT